MRIRGPRSRKSSGYEYFGGVRAEDARARIRARGRDDSGFRWRDGALEDGAQLALVDACIGRAVGAVGAGCSVAGPRYRASTCAAATRARARCVESGKVVHAERLYVTRAYANCARTFTFVFAINHRPHLRLRRPRRRLRGRTPERASARRARRRGLCSRTPPSERQARCKAAHAHE